MADLVYGPEYGYISIKALLEFGVEFDFYHRPQTVAEQMNVKYERDYSCSREVGNQARIERKHSKIID